jgi:hypothetical protein
MPPFWCDVSRINDAFLRLPHTAWRGSSELNCRTDPDLREENKLTRKHRPDEIGGVRRLLPEVR